MKIKLDMSSVMSYTITIVKAQTNKEQDIMKILVNSKIRDLTIIDPKTGCEWTQDLIGNADGFDGYDDDQEMYYMDMDTFIWWDQYITKEEKLQNRVYKLSVGLTNEDQNLFDQDMIDAADNDMEMMTMAQTQVVENWEKEISA